MAVGPFVIGSVDAINGKEGEEVPEFVATRHELERLAVHWWTERINRDFDWFVYQQTGSSEWRWSVYIARRLNRLGQILGEEAMDEAFDNSAARWRKLYRISDEDWRVFTQGSDQEREAWREAQWRRQEEAEAQAAVMELAEDASKSEGSSDSAGKTEQAIADHKCVTCGAPLPKGSKYVWQGRNRWCEQCFWREDGDDAIKGSAESAAGSQRTQV